MLFLAQCIVSTSLRYKWYKIETNNLFGVEMATMNKQLFMDIINDNEIYQKRIHSLVRWQKDSSVH